MASVQPADAPAKGDAVRQDHSALLSTARDRFITVAENESRLREDQLDDKRFRASEQWPTHVIAERARDKRPLLTVNRLPQFIKQVTNQARQNRQSIQVSPVDDHADPDTAEVFQGIIRHIENRSHAQVAYDTAVEDQVTIGRGFIRLLTEYASDSGPDAFRQEIRIRRVPDASRVYMDPCAIEPDYSDAEYGFEHEDLDLATFKAKYPKAQHVTETDFQSIGDSDKYWLPDGTVRVLDYFYAEYEDVTILLMQDGSVISEADLEDYVRQQVMQQLGRTRVAAGILKTALATARLSVDEGGWVLDERVAKKRTIKFVKMTALEVLEESIWPGRWIPIIPVIGDEIRVNGRVDYRGIVRDSKDQQRVYNYQVTALVETIAQAPRSPFIIAEGQVEPFKRMWAQANQKNFAYLPYKPQTVGGQLAPPPQRQNFEPAIQAIVAAVQQADNDLKATTGFYDASLGERGPEQSGKAILARQRQGELGSANYIDNLGRALWAIGRQLIDLIPKIYDAPRVLRIIGADDQKKTVMVHAGRPEDVPQALPRGVQKVYDLSIGTYDIVISAGSANTRRQEAVEMMTQAIQANPDLMQIIGDLYFGSMDWPFARQIGERLKKTLPPNLQDDPEGEIPPQVQAQMAQMDQMVQELTAALKMAQDELRTKAIETASRENVELMKGQIELTKMQMQLAANAENTERQASEKRAELLLKAEMERIAKLFDANVERINREQERGDEYTARQESRIDSAREAEASRRHASTEAHADRSFQAEQAERAAKREKAAGAGKTAAAKKKAAKK